MKNEEIIKLMLSRKYNYLYILVCASFILISFQTIKAIIPFYEYIVLTFSIITVLIVTLYFILKNGLIDREGILLVTIFLLAYVYGFLISFYYQVAPISFEVIGRYFVMMPFVFMGFYFTTKIEDLTKVGKVYMWVIVLGSVSVIYQYFTGPIEWFHESSTRLGQERYASLIGGLTTLGVVGTFGIIHAYFLLNNKYIKLFTISLIATGMVLSLQKAAIANLLVLLLVYMIYQFNIKKILIFLFALFSLLIAVNLIGSHHNMWLITYLKIFLGIEEGVDKSLIESIDQRLWELPSKLVDEYGYIGMLSGVGVAGGAGILGLSYLPMAHNNLIDLLFIGGAPLLLSMITLITYAITKIKAIIPRDSRKLYYLYYSFLLLNAPFYSGINFHPVMAPYFFIITATLVMASKKYTN